MFRPVRAKSTTKATNVTRIATPHSRQKRSMVTKPKKRTQTTSTNSQILNKSPQHVTTSSFSTQGSSSAKKAAQLGKEEMDAEFLNVVSPELIFGSHPFMAPSTTGVSVARYYTNVNATKPREHWDYDHHRIVYHTPDRYDAYRKLGRGKYSEVFAGMKQSTEEPVIIKILKPVKKKKIRREVLSLKHLVGMPYCSQLIDVLKDPVNRTTTLITRFNEAEDFKTLFPRLTANDVRTYTYQLLWALDYAHSQGIMHRDIKPQNVVIDHENQILRLVDWGLAEFYHPNTEYNCRVASRYFKGPELLLNMKDYDYSTDLWSFGATLAGMIYVVHPFFNGTDNLDMITKQARIVGSDSFHKYMDKYKIADHDGEFKRLIGNHPKKPLDLFINNVNKHHATYDVIDLILKLLVVYHNEHLSGTEAMAHPYFDPVRDFVVQQHDQLAAQLKEEIIYRAEVDKQIAEHQSSEDGGDVVY